MLKLQDTRKKLSWRKRLRIGLIWEFREHSLLDSSVGEEDPNLHLEHLLKVEVDETLVYTNEEDEDMEDVVVADGTADVKVVAQLLRPKLAHSVLIVVSMDITFHNVQELQVHPAAVALRSL